MQLRVANDIKLSDGGGRRGSCMVSGKMAGWKQLPLTPGAVRCIARLNEAAGAADTALAWSSQQRWLR